MAIWYNNNDLIVPAFIYLVIRPTWCERDMPYEQYRRYSLLTMVFVAAAFETEALRIHGLGTVKAFYTICDQSIILWDLKVAENTIFTKFFVIACHEMFYKFSVSTKLLPFVKLPQDF